LAWPIGTVAAVAQIRARLPGGETIQWTVDELRAAVEAPLPRLWNEREEEA
jgi:hypothetical protein